MIPHIYVVLGVGREAAECLVFEDSLLHQTRVERVEACSIRALNAVIVLTVRDRGKIERLKVCLAKGKRTRAPDHCQPQGDGRSNR